MTSLTKQKIRGHLKALLIGAGLASAGFSVVFIFVTFPALFFVVIVALICWGLGQMALAIAQAIKDEKEYKKKLKRGY